MENHGKLRRFNLEQVVSKHGFQYGELKFAIIIISLCSLLQIDRVGTKLSCITCAFFSLKLNRTSDIAKTRSCSTAFNDRI